MDAEAAIASGLTFLGSCAAATSKENKPEICSPAATVSTTSPISSSHAMATSKQARQQCAAFESSMLHNCMHMYRSIWPFFALPRHKLAACLRLYVKRSRNSRLSSRSGALVSLSTSAIRQHGRHCCDRRVSIELKPVRGGRRDSFSSRRQPLYPATGQQDMSMAWVPAAVVVLLSCGLCCLCSDFMMLMIPSSVSPSPAVS